MRRADYSRDGVLRSLEASLRRLGLDRIDVVYVHDPDDHLDAAISQAIPAVAELREQGVVGAIGAGMNAVAPLLRIVAETDLDVVMVAGRWTLADRTAAPFNSGLLAHPWPPDDARFDYGPAPAALLRRARALALACDRNGATLPHAAIRFPLRHPAVACVVAGVRSAEQARSATAWAATDLPPAAWRALGQ
nr:aldo/keto reductase [Streptomyces sp. 846.5]